MAIHISRITSDPRILLWDLETSKMAIEGYTYSRKQFSNYLPDDWIKHPVWIHCAAWKWLDKNTINSTSVLKDKERFKKDFRDDYHVVSALNNLMYDADIIVAHNGDNFDTKILNARLLYHGFAPIPKIASIDTLKLARRRFKIESNTLRYLARFLNVAHKDNAPDWSKVAQGCPKEIKYSEKYCRQDIRALEGVYKKLAPWDELAPNANTFGHHHDVCSKPHCRHWDLEHRGFRRTRAGVYKRYQCKACGGWSQGKKNLKIVNMR